MPERNNYLNFDLAGETESYPAIFENSKIFNAKFHDILFPEFLNLEIHFKMQEWKFRKTIESKERDRKAAFFKVCTKCSYKWKTRDDFLSDPSISLIGFLADFKVFNKGSYLFNHLLANDQCNSTLAIDVSCFLDLYNGTLFKDLKVGSKECSGYCAKVEVMKRCNVHCRNVVAREIMHKILNINSRKPKQI